MIYKHIIFHTGDNAKQSQEYGKCFTVEIYLIVQLPLSGMSIHTKDNQHSRENCGNKLADKGSLTKHTLDRFLADKGSLTKHTLDRFLADKGSLTKHTHGRFGGKTYSCESCGKSFEGQDAFKVHMCFPTGEKPYKCGTCGKLLTLKGNLTKHMLIHTGNKPYICGICGKSYI